MSLPILANGGPDPLLLARFKTPFGVPKAVQKRAEFFVFFAERVYPLLATYRSRLVPAYHTHSGRPALEPVLLLGVLMLQFVERLPDRQAVEAMQYDLRWRVALHLRTDQAACDPSLLSVFRDRLLRGGHERLAFEAVLALLIAEGWVPRRSKQRLDFTHICGLLARMSRLECVRETIRLALEAVEARGPWPAEWTALWERYVESKVDPRSTAETLKQKVREAGSDLQLILAWADQQGAVWEQAEEIQLLRRVFGERYDLDETGALRSTQARPPGAVQNPHEPEAQWSSKATTKTKEWVGYKTQVAETVQDENCQPREPRRTSSPPSSRKTQLPVTNPA